MTALSLKRTFVDTMVLAGLGGNQTQRPTTVSASESTLCQRPRNKENAQRAARSARKIRWYSGVPTRRRIRKMRNIMLSAARAKSVRVTSGSSVLPSALSWSESTDNLPGDRRPGRDLAAPG